MPNIFKNIWMKASLKKKIGMFAVMLAFVMGLSGLFNTAVVNFAVENFHVILNENSLCNDFQEAIELETEAFEVYVRDKTEENRQEYVLACVRTERCMSCLPFDYGKIGGERYARTWNVINGYENYRVSRDAVLAMDRREEGYIAQLYKVYDMQEYLQLYTRRLCRQRLKREMPDIRNGFLPFIKYAI